MSQHALFSCTITGTPYILAEKEVSGGRPSALVAPPLPLVGCQQDDQPTPVRNVGENTVLVHPAAVKANEPYEQRPHGDDEETKVVGKADEPIVSSNTNGPLDNEAAETAFWNEKSVPAHLVLKPTGAESRCVWRAMHPDTLSALGLKKTGC